MKDNILIAIIYLLAIILMLISFVNLLVRPSASEYHHCMVTSTDKNICASLK